MTLIPAARLLSECGMLYTVLLMLPGAWPAGLLAGTALLCGLGCTLAAYAGKRTFLRCLCALVLLPAFLIPGDLMPRCCMILPVLYAAVLIVTGQIYPDPWRYARHVRLSVFFALLFLIIGCTLRAERVYRILTWGNVYFVFGVYFQHQLRLGEGGSLRGRLQDLASISILPAGAAAVVGLIAGGLGPISKAILGFVSLVGRLMLHVVHLATHLYNNPDIPLQELTEPVDEATETIPGSLLENAYPDAWPQIRLSSGIFLGLAFAGLLLILGLMVFGAHRFRQRSTAARGERQWSEADEAVENRPDRVRTASETGNRRRIRKTYIAYLRLLRSRGMFRKSTDTSREVLDASAPFADSDMGNDLRRIYIRARYHTDVPVPDGDVKTAGELLKEIRRTAKKK